MAEGRKRTVAGRGQQAAAAQPGTAASWRQFPEMEKLFDRGERDTVISRIENTCRALDEQARSADARSQERARAALLAYGRTLQLIDELAELRESMAARK